MKGVHVACVQYAPRVGDPQNVQRAEAAIASGAMQGADVIVLPELCTSGYVFTGLDEARALAWRADDVRFDGWARAAGSAIVVGGFVEQDDNGGLYNSAAVVDASGVRAVYRKVHLWDAECEIFSPGDAAPPIVDTAFGPLGVLICYDLEFPEISRMLALAGALLLCVPANWPREDRPAPLPVPMATLAMATARFSRVFVALCDRCGDERGVQFEGGSVIVGPEGIPLAGPAPEYGPGTLHAACDLDLARTKAWNARNDAFADRRPEVYKGIGVR